MTELNQMPACSKPLLQDSADFNVLSLFDGISCGQIALERAGIDVTNYYASEIDKHAIAVTQHNYPNTKQLGNGWNVNTVAHIFSSIN